LFRGGGGDGIMRFRGGANFIFYKKINRKKGGEFFLGGKDFKKKKVRDAGRGGAPTRSPAAVLAQRIGKTPERRRTGFGWTCAGETAEFFGISKKQRRVLSPLPAADRRGVTAPKKRGKTKGKGGRKRGGNGKNWGGAGSPGPETSVQSKKGRTGGILAPQRVPSVRRTFHANPAGRLGAGTAGLAFSVFWGFEGGRKDTQKKKKKQRRTQEKTPRRGKRGKRLLPDFFAGRGGPKPGKPPGTACVPVSRGGGILGVLGPRGNS